MILERSWDELAALRAARPLTANDLVGNWTWTGGGRVIAALEVLPMVGRATLYVMNFWVDRPLQGRGRGRAILAAFCAALDEVGADCQLVPVGDDAAKTERLYRFYRRFGFAGEADLVRTPEGRQGGRGAGAGTGREVHRGDRRAR